MSELTTTSAPLHGPGGLLATPGMGSRRRWGRRTKAQQIAGNLYRGDNGKFQAGGAGGPSTKKPSAGARAPGKQTLPAVKPLRQPKGRRGRAPVKPKPTPADAQAKRDQADAAKRTTRDQLLTEAGIDANTQGALTDARDGNTLTLANGAKLAGMGLAEQAADGSYRLTPAGRTVVDAAMRGDAGRVRDALSKAGDAAAKPAKAPKAGGGGGGAAKPTDDDKQREAAQKKRATALATAQQVGITPDALDTLTALSTNNVSGLRDPKLLQLGLVVDEGMNGFGLSDQGRRALAALESGDARRYQAALQDARNRLGRETAAQTRRTDAAAKRTVRQAEIAKRRAEAAAKRAAREAAAAARQAERDAQMPKVAKSFAVFKDAKGQMRWLARTTTAYEDRDKEILSMAALDADSKRMTATKQFGPLRWWHVGQPDPLSDTAPWGPGLDLGWCDYSALIGRTRVESGTFNNPAIAQKMARIADRLEMSPGFFHPLDQPSEGVFSDIRTFERSPVPTRWARASNRFTGFTVKETSMDLDEMERRFKAAVAELGLDKEQATALGMQLVATEKAAQQQGVAFKAQAAAPAEITIGGVVYALKGDTALTTQPVEVAAKAAPPPPEVSAEKAPMPPAEMVEAGMTEVDDGLAEEAAEEPEGGPYVGDMTPDEFFARLTELLAPVLKMQDMVKSIGDMTGELKSLYGGTATKETAELTALKAESAKLAAKIAAIEGNQPAVVLPDEVAAAMKSTGPSAPESDPNAVVVPNDPNRPFAALGAATMPELYRGYGENGWVKQP